MAKRSVKRSPEDAKEVEKRIGSVCHGTKVEASFEEDYDLGGLLETGTFSSFREATRKADGVKAAVKIVERSNLDEVGLGRLRREACLLRELEHPNVVKLYGLYEEKTTLYMSLELCQGGDLLDFIASKNSYNEKDARGLVRTLLTTVKHMHDNNIVHCDLQPKNLLLVAKCDIANLKLAGFRFATKENTASDNCPTSHSSPEYLAPEIWNSEPCGSSVDTWSVGVLTYILVAGYSPFPAGNQVKMARRIKKGVFTFKREHWAPPISREIEELIKRMLTVNPANRISAEDALNHPWLREGDALLEKKNLKATLPRLRAFNAKRKLRAIFFAASAATILLSDRPQAIFGAEGRKGHVFRRFVREAPTGEQVIRFGSMQDMHGGTLFCPSQFPRPSDSISTERDDCEPGDKEEGGQLRQDDIGIAKPGPQVTLRKTLATYLVASKCYESVDGGIRLAVQEKSLADQPKTGPIEVEETARIVTCDGQDYFIGRIVHCKPSGISFPEPLLLDFYIQDEEGEEGEEGEPSLDEILQTYQVLHLDGHGEWHTVPKQQLSLSSFQDRGSRTTFLRTQVDHFSGYANGRRVNPNDRYTYGKQQDNMAVIIKNGTSRPEPEKKPKHTRFFARLFGRKEADGGPDQSAESGTTLLVVSVPIELESRRDTERGYQAGLGVAEVGAKLGTRARVHTEKCFVQGATRPHCQSVLDRGTGTIVVGAPKQHMRVLVCTLEECAGLRGGNDEQKMTLWDDIQVYGGQEIGILPKFFEGMRLKSTKINKEDPCNALLDVAMALAGFSLDVGAGPSHGVHS